jgi:3-keto steroid reductase
VRVRRTVVLGWGMSGLVGEEVEALGRKKGSVDVGKEEREEFEALGVRCWREMERMRAEWEEKLGVGRD